MSPTSWNGFEHWLADCALRGTGSNTGAPSARFNEVNWFRRDSSRGWGPFSICTISLLLCDTRDAIGYIHWWRLTITDSQSRPLFCTLLFPSLTVVFLFTKQASYQTCATLTYHAWRQHSTTYCFHFCLYVGGCDWRCWRDVAEIIHIQLSVFYWLDVIFSRSRNLIPFSVSLSVSIHLPLSPIFLCLYVYHLIPYPSRYFYSFSALFVSVSISPSLSLSVSLIIFLSPHLCRSGSPSVSPDAQADMRIKTRYTSHLSFPRWLSLALTFRDRLLGHGETMMSFIKCGQCTLTNCVHYIGRLLRCMSRITMCLLDWAQHNSHARWTARRVGRAVASLL